MGKMEATEIRTSSFGYAGAGDFTPADVLGVFSADFLDAEACREWIVARLHPEGPRCPSCRAPIDDDRRLDRWRRGLRIQCGFCGKFYTATTGTMLSGKHCDPRQAILLAAAIGLGLDNATAARLVGCNPETVRLWRHRFEALKCQYPQSRQ